MEGWLKTQLGQVCRFKSGDAFKKERQGHTAGAIPFVKVSDLNLCGNEISINRSNNWITESESRSYTIHPVGAVLFAKIGIALTYNRRRRIVRSTVADNNLMSAIPTTVAPEWLYYLLCTLDFNKISSGSALPYLTVRDLAAIDIEVPPQSEQQAIAAVLSAFDDKIELNRRMNETLEASARALFRDWFVDFGPTRAKAEGRPAYHASDLWSLFPDRLSDDGVPEGWERLPLADLSSELRRGLSPAYIPEGGVRVLNQKCIRNSSVEVTLARRHDAQRKAIDGRTITPGDLLVNSTGVGTLGRTAQIWQIDEPTIVDSHVTVVRADPRKISPYLLGRDLTLRELEIEALGEGSTGQTELSRVRLGGLDVLRPDTRIQARFDEVIKPLIDMQNANLLESRTLTATRDALLPKLMSGEIRVAEAEALAA